MGFNPLKVLPSRECIFELWWTFGYLLHTFGINYYQMSRQVTTSKVYDKDLFKWHHMWEIRADTTEVIILQCYRFNVIMVIFMRYIITIWMRL